jgi:hypothetical protein
VNTQNKHDVCDGHYAGNRVTLMPLLLQRHLYPAEETAMIHDIMLAAQTHPEAAGFILSGIKGVFVAVGSVIAAVICAVIAGVKGRSAVGWGILGLFFSIITLIVVLVIPRKND